jgi:hypothetical protein
MSPSSRPAAHDRRVGRSSDADEAPPFVGLAIAGWLVPGAGQFLQGRVQKAAVFFVTLLAMFVVGIASGGRLFPFQPSDPLVFLEAVAEWMIALPRLVAGLAGYGAGDVTAVTYEYGNTFLIVAGLLNALVVLDAVDVAKGRKAR